MSSQEFAENYVKEYFSKFIKFLIIQLILDVAEIAVFVFLIIKFIDNSAYLYITIAAFIVILAATVFLNIRQCFGSFHAFVKDANIYNIYSNAVNDYKKTNDKESFDNKMTELETKIRE